jgi:hypothetical protein
MFVWNISYSKKNSEKIYVYLYVKYPLFSSDLNKIWIRQVSEK